jgi:hypothetical protein
MIALYVVLMYFADRAHFPVSRTEIVSAFRAAGLEGRARWMTPNIAIDLPE